MSTIQYVRGDATLPIGIGSKLIAHVTNNRGGWGRGFVGALSKRWKEPELYYRNHPEDHILGVTQFVKVSSDVHVANMCAQDGYSGKFRPAISYRALELCLHSVRCFAMKHNLSVHMPMIDCGLGGGSWDYVRPIIERQLTDLGIRVTVYKI
jgi:O-acetyl-ADP-ribose deacetylase (regulator of RNase III)